MSIHSELESAPQNISYSNNNRAQLYDEMFTNVTRSNSSITPLVMTRKNVASKKGSHWD